MSEYSRFKKDNEKKLTFRLDKDLVDNCDRHTEQANCRSRTEFIENALNFYIRYLDSGDSVEFLAPVLINSFDTSVKASEQHLAHCFFKVAVELAKLSNMLATVNEYDEDQLRKLHIHCVDEVKKVNGIIDFEDAVRFQNS